MPSKVADSVAVLKLLDSDKEAAGIYRRGGHRRAASLQLPAMIDDGTTGLHCHHAALASCKPEARGVPRDNWHGGERAFAQLRETPQRTLVMYTGNSRRTESRGSAVFLSSHSLTCPSLEASGLAVRQCNQLGSRNACFFLYYLLTGLL